MRILPVIAVFGLGLAACGGSSDHAPTEPAAAARSTPTPEPVEPIPAAPTPTPEPASQPVVPDASGFGDPCDDGSPCDWDDPCVPTRCVGGGHAALPICDESAPAPGDCMCVAGHCSLRPNTPPEPSASCKLTRCGLDQGAASCTAGTMLEANRFMREQGPACDCDQSTLQCVFTWVEPIPCETVEQCWVSDAPPYHPIPRPRALGKRKFRPCHDGEVAPVCTNGSCSLAAYSC